MEIDEKLQPVHPGEILREDFLIPTGMTAYRLAKSLGMTPTVVKGILDGERNVTANVALRLARFLGTSAQFWMNLQTRYDLEVETDRRAEEIAKITPYERAA